MAKSFIENLFSSIYQASKTIPVAMENQIVRKMIGEDKDLKKYVLTRANLDKLSDIQKGKVLLSNVEYVKRAAKEIGVEIEIRQY